ncbi:MAG: T9SS type A sorting domain-containing protein [Chitinophagales bacterium]
MKPYLFLLLLLLPFYSISQVTVAWEQPTRGNAIAVDASNNVYTVDYESNLGDEMKITKRDADGNFIWVTSYNQTDNTKWERASWITCDNNGNIIVTGTSMSGFSNPVEAASIVMKFNAAGNLLWRNVYESSFDGSSTRKCLVDANNNIYVLGMGSGPAGYVTKVKKFKPNGTALWSYFDSDGIGVAINFKFTPDNKMVISGRSLFGSVNGYSKIDLDGNKIWSLPLVFSLTVGDVAGDTFGNSYVVHTEYVFNGTTEIKKLDNAGNILWDHVYGMSGNKIEVGTDNKAVISGYPNAGAGAAFFKIDENGNQLWINLDADGPQALFLHALLLLDNNNNAYLAAGTLFNMAVCKVNNDGTNGWTALTNSGGYANSMVFGKNLNSIFVVGGITARLNDETVPVCEPSANIFFNSITPASIKVSWDAVPGAVQYELWRKKSSAASNWKVVFVAGDKTSKNIKNLACNTSFDFKIRTVCDVAGTVVSAFSPVFTATTSPCKLESEMVTENPLKVYPNPASDQISVELMLPDAVSNGRIELMDVNGRIVISQGIADLQSTVVNLDVRSLTAGIYFVRIIGGQNILTQKLVIE